MSVGSSVLFVPASLPAGRLTAAIKATLTGFVFGTEAVSRATVTRELPDGSTERRNTTEAELDGICDLGEGGITITTGAGSAGTWFHLTVQLGELGHASVSVEAPSAGIGQQMLDTFFSAAGLEVYSPPPPPGEGPQAALGTVTQPLAQVRRLRAFVSFRFGIADTERAACELLSLLSLTNVETVTGKGFEPRPLQKKVADRIAGVDVVILLIGSDGQSAWTRDEINEARMIGVPVIPLVEEPATFERGLFGDLEYITFAPRHIGDTFVGLLEGLAYVRRQIDQRDAAETLADDRPAAT